MIAQAKAKFVRLSPMKTRQVIDLIRGKDVPSALITLAHVNKGPTKLISKVLNAGVSNAKQKGLSEDQLYISKIVADQGPSWKRYRSAPFGRATTILKKTTHLTIELDLITK
ncbi:MAG: 50S ribosomal protein L22 [Candidatus Omnitrophica bacterium]|nr:50S ribosomal protein L22 [Candidatus Omnitrophota bacterium]